MKTFQDRDELEQLRAIVEQQARTIEAQNERVNEMWSDWRKERDNALLATKQRNEARQFAVDFMYLFNDAREVIESYKIMAALDRDEIEASHQRIAELENSIKDEAWEETDERWGE